MRWIGQHIYDQVSRFRGKVYVEDDLSITGSITSTDDLALIATGNEVTIDTDNLVVSSATSNKPQVIIKNTANDTSHCQLWLAKNKGAAGADGDEIGRIYFVGDDTIQTQTGFGEIKCTIEEADHLNEAGKLELRVANDGTLRNVITGTGIAATAAEVDVTIANGAASVTTIAGTLTMGSTAAMTNTGLLSVGNQTGITGVGTITTGVWSGTAIASSRLDADTAHLTTDQTFTGAKTFDEDIVGETTVQKWIKNVAYVATQGTTETFIPMVGAAENTSVGNGAMAMIMPTAGKLLKVHLKTQRDHSGVTTTIKMYNWDADEAHGSTTETLLGSVAQTGPADDAVGVFDFQSVSTNAFTAGEMLAFSITNDGAVSSSCKYFVTLVFELDWASY